MCVEITKGNKALQGASQLKDTYLALDVQMETTDLSPIKTFVLLPVTSDTTKHVMDTLTAFLGKKVYIERQTDDSAFSQSIDSVFRTKLKTSSDRGSASLSSIQLSFFFYSSPLHLHPALSP
jgi:hypothetical protein